jgi:hypothetical protein
MGLCRHLLEDVAGWSTAPGAGAQPKRANRRGDDAAANLHAGKQAKAPPSLGRASPLASIGWPASPLEQRSWPKRAALAASCDSTAGGDVLFPFSSLTAGFFKDFRHAG